MWLIILRPLIILQTLILAKEGETRSSGSPNYLDFGTHLVLIFSSLLVPFSGYGGLRSSTIKDDLQFNHNDNHFNDGSSSPSLSCDYDSIGSQCNSSICSQQQQHNHQHDNQSINSNESYIN